MHKGITSKQNQRTNASLIQPAQRVIKSNWAFDIALLMNKNKLGLRQLVRLVKLYEA